jgi:sigma-E factor negative regulatory protein RseC
MIEQQAIVTQIASGQVWIKSQQSGCGQCVQLASCSTATLAKLLPKREFSVETELELKVGDVVLVAVDDTHLLSTTLLLYFVPILVMLITVGVANAFLPIALADAYLPIIALFSLVAFFYLLHRFQAVLLLYFCFKPQIIKRLP